MALPKSFVSDTDSPTSFAPDPSPLDGFGSVDRRDWIEKAGDGIRNSPLSFTAPLGGALGNAVGSLTTAAKFAVKGKFTEARAALKPTPDEPTPLQVAGSAAASAATPASLVFGGTGTLASKILTSMGLGATISGGAAAADGAKPDEALKSAALGGAFSSAIPVAGAGFRAIGNQIDNLPTRFIESALGRSKADVLKEMKNGKDSLTEYVLKKKSIGTAENLINGSQEAIEGLSDRIRTNLAQAARTSGEKITIGRDNFLDELAALPEAEGALLKRNEIRGVIERLAPQAKKLLQKSSWTLEEANSLRQLLDRTVGDRGFLANQLSVDKQILKSSANSLRETVKVKAPEETRALFSELSSEIRLRDALLDKLAKRAGNQVLSFGDFIGGGLGGVFGGGVPGAVAGIATRRAIESVPFKMTTAKAISALTKAGPVLEALAPAQKTALLTLFAELFSPDAEPNQ